MKRKGKSNRTIPIIFVSLVLIYMLAQVYVGNNGFTATIDAVNVTATDKLSVNGVFSRAQVEVALPEGNTAAFLYDDGEKVGANQSVALVFSNTETQARYIEYRELLRKKESLQSTISSIAVGADGAKLGLLIKEAIADFPVGVNNMDIDTIESGIYQIKSLVTMQEISKHSKDLYRDQLDSLNEEIRSYGNAFSTSNNVKTPAAGYFFSYSDGFDAAFQPENISSISSSDIENATAQQASGETTNIGKVVTGFEWYYSAVVDDAAAKRLKNMKNAKVSFTQLSSELLPVTIVSVKAESPDKNILTVMGTYMKEAVMATRAQQGELVLSDYTGLKVPKNAVHQDGGKWGVYCLVGDKAVFKETEWIFETDSYYIVKQAENSEKGLYEYDKIILSSKLIEK